MNGGRVCALIQDVKNLGSEAMPQGSFAGFRGSAALYNRPLLEIIGGRF
jgi:hypothetical protein